jgi:glycerol-3-phosphate dehydrogenase
VAGFLRSLQARARPERQLAAGANEVDLVVIGAGVNGSGVARDAAMRGLKVALFERNDIAFGASGNSSGMIHGGARYLTSDPEVTYTSCKDSGYVQQIAKHLLFRIPFLLPVPNAKKALFPLIDGFFEAYDRYQPLKRGKPHVRLRAEELLQLEPGLSGDVYGGFSFDEWGIDGSRLCVANVRDAHERGAEVHCFCTVEKIERNDRGDVCGVRYRDRRSGCVGRVSTASVVNATGAWAPITASLGQLDAKVARVRPGKGVHVVYDKRLSNYAVMGESIDGRTIFVEPWQNMTVVGTTDDDYYGDLDDVVATGDEVRYLVEGIARVFPSIREARIVGTYAGVRPTLYDYGKTEDKLSRDHEIIDHAEHGADGLYSMVGGKLASYRLFSEEMVDVLARRFDLAAQCTSHLIALPGGEVAVDSFSFAEEVGIDAVAARRLCYRHGSRTERIAERLGRRPSERRVVCLCEPVLEAEVRYAVRDEFARSVDDVSRRTRLGLGACGAMRCAAQCGAIVAEECGYDAVEGQRQALRFLRKQARTRVCALGPQQARQEALAIASIRSQLNLGEEKDGQVSAVQAAGAPAVARLGASDD